MRMVFADVGVCKDPLPTEEEARTLRKVADRIPKVAYMLCIIEFAERASYYGVQTVFANFMQFPLPAGGNGAGAPPVGTQETAGALGKGLQFSVAMGLLFLFLAYIIPIAGGWVADTKLGRFKTILIGVLVCGVSHIIMICGAIPSVLQAGHAMAPFMISLILLAIGAVSNVPVSATRPPSSSPPPGPPPCPMVFPPADTMSGNFQT